MNRRIQRKRTLANCARYAFAFFLAIAFCEYCVLNAPAQDANPNNSGDVAPVLNFSRGISKIFRAPKTQTSASDSDDKDATVALPIPNDADVLLSTPSINVLNESLGEMFQQTGSERVNFLTTLKLTDYGKVIDCLNLSSPVATFAFCRTSPPTIVVALPLHKNRYEDFLNALVKATKGGELKIDEKSGVARFNIDLIETVSISSKLVDCNYALLTASQDEAIFASFNAKQTQFNRPVSGIAPALTNSIVSFEVSPKALQLLTAPSRPFWNDLQQLFAKANIKLDALEDFSIDDVRKYVADNLLSLRYDLAIDEYGLYAAISTRPRPDSPAAKQLANYRNPSPINPDPDRFFSILPDVESALAGHLDLPGSSTESLPKPFNRVRFVEYCLGLPAAGELAAESWLFYLEVDDSEEFAKEMIVPKAREIGRFIGSNQAGEAASQLLGDASKRRLERQLGRRNPPRRLPDPERAAALGGAIGSAIGGLIGESTGEETAMKAQRINGFKTYVSDIETYTRQSALMRAQQEGRSTPSGSIMDHISPVDAVVSVINGDDALQKMMLRVANAKAYAVDQTPLVAKTGYLVILNKNEMLFSLGNEDLLRLAINNYSATRNPQIQYQSVTEDQDAVNDLRQIVARIPNASSANVIGATRVDLASSQAYYRWFLQAYLQKEAPANEKTLPATFPKSLLLSSVDDGARIQRFVVPHSAVVDLIHTYVGDKTLLEIIVSNSVKGADAESTEDAKDFDVDFDE